MASLRNQRCIQWDDLHFAKHKGDDGNTLRKKWLHKQGKKQKQNGKCTSNNGGGWICNLLNPCLDEKMTGYLSRGVNGNLLAFAFTFHKQKFFLIGSKSWIILSFQLLLQFNHLMDRVNKVVVKGFFLLGHESTRAV